ncbi:hypothetical protein [Naasia sp. SYSU D00057]|uniref:hypothetical protein n=1 Tax=Naasia sp. SYSU D00057 TaxID=2817380 RepID=UPI001B3012DE|nr:hypothetical protein [Naasia sp. SYSU D00057]
MRRVYYAGSHVLTSDRVCKAMLRFARALAENQSSDVVSIPVVTEGGSRAYAHFLLGPASQIFSTPVENSADEPFDADVVRDLEERTRLLHPSTPDWPDEMIDVPDLDLDLDLDRRI